MGKETARAASSAVGQETGEHKGQGTERQRGPRKDQIRNRARLLDSARAAFVDMGPDISIETIARGAEVGATTFYRHFPTKDDLIAALMDRLAEGAEKVALSTEEIEDPWEAFTAVFLNGCVLDDTDLLLFENLCRTSSQAAERGQQISTRLVEPVLRRVRAAGLLSTEVGPDDVATFMRMTETGSKDQRNAAKRLILTGLKRQPRS